MRSPGSRGEGGNTTALEGMFVAVFLVTAAALVAPVERVPSIASPAREAMEDMTTDLLAGFKEFPLSERYTTLLEKVVAKGVGGNASAFEALVKRTMPVGAECRLWVDNGHASRQVAGPSERLARESVSASRLWRPEWAYAFAVPGFDLVSESQPLPVQGYMVSQGSLVKERGVPIDVTVTTDQGVYHKGAMTAARPGAPTVSLFLLDENSAPGLHHMDDPAAPVSSPRLALSAPGPLPQPQTFTVGPNQDTLDMTTYVGGTSVRYSMSVRSPLGVTSSVSAERAGWNNRSIPFPEEGEWTFSAGGTISGNPVTPAQADLWVNSTVLGGNSDWTFVVRHEAGTPLPAGTELNVSLPGVLTGLFRTSQIQAGWDAITIQEGTTTMGAWVSAKLASPLSNGQRLFTVKASFPVDGDALYPLTATLSQGAAARAGVVIGSTAGSFSLGNTLDRGVSVSVPKPQAGAAVATWGAVFATPTSVGLVEAVTQVDIRTADKANLFQAVQGIAPGTGSWSLVGPGHVRWSGLLSVEANAAVSFLANVTLVADVETDDEPGVALPLSFPGAGGMEGGGGGSLLGGQGFTATEFARPYVHGLTVPPPTDILGEAQSGFTVPSGSGPLSRGNASFNMTSLQRGMLVKGSASYGVTEFGTLTSLAEVLRLGLARSHVNVSLPSAKVGQEVNVTVDFQGLYDEIQVLGATVTGWKVNVSIFDPSQPFASLAQMLPSFQGEFGANGRLSLSVNPSSLVYGTWEPAASVVQTPANAAVLFVVPRDSFFGPHAIIAHAEFVVNDELGNSFVQSARQLAVIDVLPDSGQSGTALYWAVLECWLPDW